VRIQVFTGLYGPLGKSHVRSIKVQAFSDVTDRQKNNRLYFVMSATSAGMVNYLQEYWHWSSDDRYAAHWQQSDQEVDDKVAIYGPVYE